MDFVITWATSEAAIRIWTVLGTLVGVLVAMRLVQALVMRSVADRTTRYRARKAAGFLGYLVAGIILVAVFSERFGQLTILLGGVGAGVAFALQEVIVSVAGWAAVSFGGYYAVGDRVQLGGVKGDVIDIGPLRTTLMEVGQWVQGDQYNGRVVRVANSFVFKEPVVNYSGDFPFLWDELAVPVRFGSDFALVRSILETAAEEVCGDYGAKAEEVWRDIQKRHPLEDAGTKPMVSMVFDSNWATFTLRYVVAYDRRRSTKHALSERILAAVAASGDAVRIGVASTEVIPGKPIGD